MMLILPSAACSNNASDTNLTGNPDGSVSRDVLVKGQFLNPDMPRITVQKAYELWDSSTMPAFIDVRPRDLYDMGHVPGARNIINDSQDGNKPAIGDSNKAAYKALAKDKLIILYCD
jgi:3-mercaptopyruvate sulfurtransferase SseA